MPWGATNLMPFDIIDLIESDETLATCQMFNAEVCYGSGLQYDTAQAADTVAADVEDFLLRQRPRKLLPRRVPGLQALCLRRVGNHTEHRGTKDSAPYPKGGLLLPLRSGGHPRQNPAPLFRQLAKVRHSATARLSKCSMPPRLSATSAKGSKRRPLPQIRYRQPRSHARQHILSYPILCRALSRQVVQHQAAYRPRQRSEAPQLRASQIPHRSVAEILGFHIQNPRASPTAPGNRRASSRKSGAYSTSSPARRTPAKVWFSTFYVNPNGDVQHDVVINKIDSDKEGGDWESDIQEAVNMICFTLRVHSNLVGSVPGKAQTNNSGSDKRELLHHRPGSAKALSRPFFSPSTAS